MADPKNNNKKRRGWVLLLVLSLLLIVGGVTAYILTHPWWTTDFDPSSVHSVETLTPPSGDPIASDSASTEPMIPGRNTEATGEAEEGLPANPVDFDALHEINPDAYAWIYIPLGDGLDIDHPIMQSSPTMDDNYYLHHNIYKEYYFSGCIYTQRCNAKDFSDRVTVVYGHNMLNGTMFSNLINFTKSDFFDAHDVFYIYTPGHILTYKIAAAVQFDKRHILNSFDFSDDQVYADWIRNYIKEPKVMVRAVRPDVEVTTDDKLVILSTCLVHNKYRYLIQGVLIDDVLTK